MGRPVNAISTIAIRFSLNCLDKDDEA